jgi:hypothetical protein
VLYALIVVLLVLRRFRHLIIWLILPNLLSLIGASILGRSPSGRGRSGW